MSKNEPWLLVFMALGANLKMSIFDPPTVGGTYTYIYHLHKPSTTRAARAAQGCTDDKVRMGAGSLCE